MSVRSFTQRYPITAFVAVAFAFSWLWWFVAIAFGVMGLVVPPVTALASFGPALAALLVIRTLVTRTNESSEAPSARSGHRRALLVIGLVGGAIFALRVLTGGRTAFRESGPAREMSFDPGNVAVVALVVLVAAWVFASARSPDQGVRAHMHTLLRWRAGVWPWIFAFTVMPTVYLLGAGLTMAGGGSLPTPGFYTYEGTGAVGLLAVAFLYGAVFGGGNEEMGWRGFMLPALQARYSPLVASLIIAVVWSVWHLPLHIGGFYEGGTIVGQPSVVTAMTLRTIQTIPLTILFTWLYNRTDGNLLLMVVLHATVSVSALVVPYTLLAVVPGSLIIVGLVIEGRMWKQLPGSQVVT